jgi:phosphatidylserine decarboxylase
VIETVSSIRGTLADIVIWSAETFNEFFYRRLKADARPITNPQDPSTLVSCADCRMMAFESVNEATRLWIKGKEFSVGRLLGDSYKGDWQTYEGGALGIFRLVVV